MFKEHPSSLTANRADLLLEDGNTFATVEFKSWGQGYVAHWLVSGIDNQGLPAMLLELSLPMSGDDEVELAAEARAFGDAHILPIAKHLAMTKGVGSKIQPLSVSTRANLFQHHMRYQFGELRSGNLPGQLKTECLFKMASYLEVFAPLKQISEFLGVPITTVEAQVKRARAAGSLPKASEVRGRNKVNKEVH